MTYRVQWLAPSSQTKDFATERAAEFFAAQKRITGTKWIVVFEVDQ